VDEFAEVLKLQSWYEWRTSEDGEKPAQKPQGATNPELLKAKESASVMYCLNALKTFENMPLDQVREIATEIALLGRNGIDYSLPDKTYTLASLPGKTYSGLHLLCLMYVGFKMTDPTVDTTLDFEDAYQMAVRLYGS
jgi:hypothetical protein